MCTAVVKEATQEGDTILSQPELCSPSLPRHHPFQVAEGVHRMDEPVQSRLFEECLHY